MVVYSGSNTDSKSSESLKPLVMLCYGMLCYVMPTTLIDRSYVDIILLYIAYISFTRLVWFLGTMVNMYIGPSTRLAQGRFNH